MARTELGGAVRLVRWRPWEIEYLEAHAGDGAEAVASHLGRSVNSVKVMASRLRLSLRRSWECPRCGRVVHSPLNGATGWCLKCHAAASRDKAAEANRRVRAELQAEESAIADIKRDRQRIYADTHRKREKLRKLRKSRES